MAYQSKSQTAKPMRRAEVRWIATCSTVEAQLHAMNRPSNLLRGILFALGLACMLSTAKAVVVTVNSVQYDITTVTTSFNAASATLQSQPWWGSDPIGIQFATAVGGQLGFPVNSGAYGPAFATLLPSSTLVFLVGFNSSTQVVDLLQTDAAGALSYAVARRISSVPESGATIVMLGAALAGLIALRRRFL